MFSDVTSFGNPCMLTLMVVPLGSRKTVIVPVAPGSEIGFNVTATSLPTGYSMMVYVPSGFCTAFATVVVCPKAIPAANRPNITAAKAIMNFFFIGSFSFLLIAISFGLVGNAKGVCCPEYRQDLCR